MANWTLTFFFVPSQIPIKMTLKKKININLGGQREWKINKRRW